MGEEGYQIFEAFPNIERDILNIIVLETTFEKVEVRPF